MHGLTMIPSYVNEIVAAARNHEQEVRLSFTSKEAAEDATDYLSARDFTIGKIKQVPERDGVEYQLAVSWKK